MDPWKGVNTNHNFRHTISVIILWISILLTGTQCELTNNTGDVIGQKRMFGDYDTMLPPPPESQLNQETSSDYFEYLLQDNKDEVGTPKFMSSEILDPNHSTYSHVHHHHKYSDFTDKEYDNYGPFDEYYSASHDYAIPHHSPSSYSVVMKPPQSMVSKMSSFLSMDTFKILFILLLKMLLIKLKAVGILKFLILITLKLPLIFIGFFAKLFLVIKLVNFLKILIMPLFLPIIFFVMTPFIMPFILPLLLLPLLLPLLLFLPVPVLTVTSSTTSTTSTTTVAPGKRRRRYLDGSDTDLRLGLHSHRQTSGKNGFYYTDLLYFKHVVESEQCLERIACKLAADERSSPFKLYVIRILDTAKYYSENSKLHSYISAYKFGATINTTFRKCVKFYPCSKLKT